jgi:hypothetical protein
VIRVRPKGRRFAQRGRRPVSNLPTAAISPPEHLPQAREMGSTPNPNWTLEQRTMSNLSDVPEEIPTRRQIIHGATHFGGKPHRCLDPDEITPTLVGLMQAAGMCSGGEGK